MCIVWPTYKRVRVTMVILKIGFPLPKDVWDGLHHGWVKRSPNVRVWLNKVDFLPPCNSDVSIIIYFSKQRINICSQNQRLNWGQGF